MALTQNVQHLQKERHVFLPALPLSEARSLAPKTLSAFRDRLSREASLLFGNGDGVFFQEFTNLRLTAHNPCDHFHFIVLV